MKLSYTYDNFGNISYIDENYLDGGNVSNEFRSEAHNRILLGYGRWYLWNPYGRLDRFEAKDYGYDTSAGANIYAVKTVAGVLRYSYNANGNMTERYIGADDGRGIDELQLTWNVQNRLHSALDVDNSVTTTYLYDPDGIRVKKSVGSEDHYYPNRYYEMHNGAKRKYYYMGDMLIAVRESPGEFTYIHADHLGSTVGTTKTSGSETFTYRAFGESRSGTSPSTDRQYTGQKQDDNQLMYYNARYYDKYLGAFISPDTMIPDPTDVASYNRYLYANGDPIKYSDPSGHQARSIYEGIVPLPIVDGGDDVTYYIVNEMNTNIASDVANGIRDSNAASLTFVSGGQIGPAAMNKAIALTAWAYMVGPNQDWDHKGHIRDNYGEYQTVYSVDEASGDIITIRLFLDVWSNAHFGYVGSDVGFTEEELLWGAGIAQFLDEARKGFINKDYINMIASGQHDKLDDPRDQASIRVGIDLWTEHPAELTREALVHEFFSTDENLH